MALNFATNLRPSLNGALFLRLQMGWQKKAGVEDGKRRPNKNYYDLLNMPGL